MKFLLWGRESRGMTQPASVVAAAPRQPAVTCTHLLSLPRLGAPGAQWDGIEGLALVESGPSSVVDGQPALQLRATPATGRHRLGITFQGLAPNQTYRVTVAIKAAALEHMILDVRDGTNDATRIVSFNLDPRQADAPDDLPYDLNVVDGWLQPSVDAYSADGTLVVYTGLCNAGGDAEFPGDGRTEITFGGVRVAPIDAAEIMHARTTATLRHFVVTRFGIGVHNENWYRGALDLFEAITYPSLCAQTRQDFTWLVVVDRKIPESALQRLRQVRSHGRDFHIVPLDLTTIRHVRHGCFDHVWHRCQDYIIEQRLLTDPSEYLITSSIDGDDAWRRDMVELVHGHLRPELARLVADERSRSAVVRHTCGQVLTFPRGLQWFAQADVVQPLDYEFIGMSVFVLARFSSGISVLSSRHSAWAAMAHALMFNERKLHLDRPMWAYVRHDRTQVAWQIDTAVSDPVCDETLHADFGIDFAKMAKWRANDAVRRAQSLPDRHVGLSGGEQQDCCFRIAALNCQIAALERKQQHDVLDNEDALLLLKQREARLRLLETLQRQGQQLFQ